MYEPICHYACRRAVYRLLVGGTIRHVRLKSGQEFAGYTVERPLGSGGMGEVYLVRHPRLPRQDALKILPADLTADDEYRQRFHREADLAASLWHPHIVGVHDRGEHAGQLWISMDYVGGTDVAHLLRAQPGGLRVDDVLEIVDAVADALDFAHAGGLMHRDVKPANILVHTPKTGRRRVLLADFGIARYTDDAQGLTATNITLGTVTYAPPEQLLGKPVSGQADQYALAVTAYQLLSGAPPFVNTNAAVVIGQHLNTPPPPLAVDRPELSALDPVLQRALAKEPLDRFPSCLEFAGALRAAAMTRAPAARGRAAAAEDLTVPHQADATALAVGSPSAAPTAIVKPPLDQQQTQARQTQNDGQPRPAGDVAAAPSIGDGAYSTEAPQPFGGYSETPMRSSGRRGVWIAAVLVLGLVCGVIAAVVPTMGSTVPPKLESTSSQWQPYVDAAVRLSKQMFTYEHGNESAAVQSMLAQSTGALRELLTKDNNVENLTKLFRDTNASSVATVDSAGLESFDGSTAVVLVALSVQVATQPSTKYRQRVSVVKEGDALMVSDVKYPDGGK